MRKQRDYFLLPRTRGETHFYPHYTVEDIPEEYRALAELVFDRRVIPLASPMADNSLVDEYGDEHNWDAVWVAYDVAQKTWILVCPDCGLVVTTGVWGDGMGGHASYEPEYLCGDDIADIDKDTWENGVLFDLPRLITTYEQRRAVYGAFGLLEAVGLEE